MNDRMFEPWRFNLSLVHRQTFQYTEAHLTILCLVILCLQTAVNVLTKEMAIQGMPYSPGSTTPQLSYFYFVDMKSADNF